MHNPLRSEADAFRWIVVIGIAAASVIALTLLTRPAIGAAWGAALVGFGVGLAWRSARGSLSRSVLLSRGERRPPAPARGRQPDGRRPGAAERDRRTAPAAATARSSSSRRRWRARARRTGPRISTRRSSLPASGWSCRCRRSRRSGLRARGQVGDSEPLVAIEDALAEFPADEIVISTHPPQRSRWLEHGVVERAREEVDLPVTHVVVDLEAEAELGPQRLSGLAALGRADQVVDQLLELLRGDQLARSSPGITFGE